MRRGFVIALLALFAAPAHGIDLHRLPLGDGKLSHAPKAGWIWACHINPNGGGPEENGPWIDEATHTFDATAKASVRGAVRWPEHRFKIVIAGDKRIITSNGLPDHPTGIFPIRPDDPAYRFDRNPNHIEAHNIRIALPLDPKLAARPSCAPPAVGIMLTGVALLNALDARGRDALAHEVQDRCDAHPQESGVYHYHSLSPCIDAKPGPDGNSPLIGYAIDGFGIFGPYAGGKTLTTADLDACHGTTSVIDWNGRKVKMYHYVATADFPYTVGCLRGRYERATVRAILGPPSVGRGFGPSRPPGPPGLGPPPYGPPPR
jgi:YHYH protein